MNQVHLDDFDREVICTYRDEIFLVRDNGAVLRCHKDGGRRRSRDEKWTFGTKDEKNGYMFFVSGVRVHQIVATAFHNPKPGDGYVVDHIDTNRCNNRPENLRWVTRLENILLNPITLRRILFHYGSVDEFLADPTKPKSGELQPDFGWMRTATKEEAEECRKRLLVWAQSEGMPSGGSLGEWIFESRSKASEAKSSGTERSKKPSRDQWLSEHKKKLAEREAEIRAKVSVNIDRPVIRLPIISRGMAQHVDYCPLEMRNYEGKPFANFIDDCLYSPCCASSEDGYVYCIGGRSIESKDDYEHWKAKAEGRAESLDDAPEEITREIDPPETLIEHKAARAVIRHINAPASLEDISVADGSYGYEGSERGRTINYPALIKIALTGLAYDAGNDARACDLTTMTGPNYPDLDRARKFLAKEEKFRIGQDPETGEFGILDVETALGVKFVEVAEKLDGCADVIESLVELLSRKSQQTESELKKFFYRPEYIKTLF